MYSKAAGVGSLIPANLETRNVNEAAVRLYPRNGYRVVDNQGKYAGNDKAVCFEKRLAHSSEVSSAER